jgi:WD40 repeat protein
LEQPGSAPRTNHVALDDSSHPLAFSQDGRLLAVADADRLVHFYELDTGAETQQLDIGSLPYRMELDPGGEILAVMTGSEVQLWHVRSRARMRTLAHTVDGTQLVWHPAGRWLAAGYRNGDLRLWDSETGEARPLAGHTDYVWSLAFDPHGEFLASQSWDSTPRFWDPATGHPLLWMRHSAILDLSSKGDQVAFRDDEGGVGAWQIIRSSVFYSLSSVSTRHPHLRGVDLSRDGRWLMFSERAAWHLFDLPHRREVAEIKSNGIRSSSFHPGGGSVVTVSADQVLRWPLEATPASDKVHVGASEIIVSLPGSDFQRGSFSTDGRWFVVAGHRRSLLVDATDPKRAIEFSKGRPQSFASFSPDDRWVVAASSVEGGVTIWDVRDGNLVHRLILGDNAQAAFSPDGRTLATATTRECALWETQSWQARRRWPLGLSGSVAVPVTFSPDGQQIAVAATRTEIRLVDARTGAELATLTSPLPQNLNSLIFSADGRWLAGHTLARAVHLWDLKSLRRELAAMNLAW